MESASHLGTLQHGMLIGKIISVSKIAMEGLTVADMPAIGTKNFQRINFVVIPIYHILVVDIVCVFLTWTISKSITRLIEIDLFIVRDCINTYLGDLS